MSSIPSIPCFWIIRLLVASIRRGMSIASFLGRITAFPSVTLVPFNQPSEALPFLLLPELHDFFVHTASSEACHPGVEARLSRMKNSCNSPAFNEIFFLPCFPKLHS